MPVGIGLEPGVNSPWKRGNSGGWQLTVLMTRIMETTSERGNLQGDRVRQAGALSQIEGLGKSQRETVQGRK